MLGVYDGPSGGAALLRGDRLVAIAQEDRIARRSRVSGLPRASVQGVLADSGVSGDQVDCVIVATRSATYAEGVGSAVRPPFLYRVTEAIPSPPSLSRVIRDSFANARRRRVDEALRSEFGASCPVLFLEHHLAHAVGAAAGAGLRNTVVVTMDGGGDGVWACATEFVDGKPNVVATENGGESILALLDAVAERLGIPEGLDRYARLEDLALGGVTIHYDQLEPAFLWDDGRLQLDENLFRSGGVLSRVRASARKEDVAASALALCAEYARRWVVHWFVRTDQATLVLGGDLFAIPSMVRAIVDAPEVNRVRVSLAPDDNGLPAGAALAAGLPEFLPPNLRGPVQAIDTPLLGHAFPDTEIEQALRDEYVEFRVRPEIESDVGRILAEGRTVARFTGRAEIGERGLGGRVILRSPAGPLRRGRVGFSIVPGAYHVVVREPDFERFFEADGPPLSDLRGHPALVSPREEFREHYPDLIAWGQRVRVQTVTENSDPGLWRILGEFATWSNVALLAAAPFRLPNEPLVFSPRDAIRTFRLLGADFAALGRYLVRAEHESGSYTAPTPDSSSVRP